jgi:hypothetical protein
MDLVLIKLNNHKFKKIIKLEIPPNKLQKRQRIQIKIMKEKFNNYHLKIPRPILIIINNFRF